MGGEEGDNFSGFDVHNALLRWVAAFLEGRTQFISIIVPSMPYSQALHLTGLPSLQERRESACIRFISKISPGNPLYVLILSRSQPKESPYNLRRNTNIVSKQTNTDRFAQFVTCKYATYLDS